MNIPSHEYMPEIILYYTSNIAHHQIIHIFFTYTIKRLPSKINFMLNFFCIIPYEILILKRIYNTTILFLFFSLRLYIILTIDAAISSTAFLVTFITGIRHFLKISCAYASSLLIDSIDI